MLPGDGPVDPPDIPCDHCGNTLRCKECAEWDGFCVVQGFLSTPCIDLELECGYCERMKVHLYGPGSPSLTRALLGFDL